MMKVESEFVAGWHLLDTIGEGRFGEVKLLLNKESNEMVACKVMQIDSAEQDKQIRKEMMLHRVLSHPNVIHFYGNRRDGNVEYLFLEYARGGELFDRIEPDAGMAADSAYRYFADLLCGVEYLHQRGIVHRDIKPENLLLDANDTLKISDFGLSTMFRFKGKERLLDNRCGSFPYMAPEVIAGVHHQAKPIDIWSCGIVLVAMLAGQLPWEQATPELYVSYRKWSTGAISLVQDPWRKIDNVALSLLKCILQPVPAKRYRIAEIRQHRWYRNGAKHLAASKKNKGQNAKPDDLRKMKRQCNGYASQPIVDLHSRESSSDICQNWPTNKSTNDQTNFAASDNFAATNSELDSIQLPASYSQPINIDDMFLSTQSQIELTNSGQSDSGGRTGNTQPGTRMYMRVVRRMTRFIAKCDFDATIQWLTQTFTQMGLPFKRCSPPIFTITINDKRRLPLVFKATVNEMAVDQILVDFRLSKGDGIEFKRQFLTIKKRLAPIIQSYGPELVL